MTAPKKLNFKMYQGSTFDETIRWESSLPSYSLITDIPKGAPTIITSAGHGIPVGWRTKVTSVLGMKEINSDSYNIVTDSTSDTVTLGFVNSLNYSTYTSGGVLEYFTPVDLASYTARMQLRTKITDTDFIDEYTTENGRIVLDNTMKTINILVPAATTEGYTFKTAVYSLEMIKDTTVTALIYGTISLSAEITR